MSRKFVNLLMVFALALFIPQSSAGQIPYPFSDSEGNRDIQAYWYNIPQDSAKLEIGHEFDFQSSLHIYGKAPEDDFRVNVQVCMKDGKIVFKDAFAIKKLALPDGLEIRQGFFKLRCPVEYLEENPAKIVVTLDSTKEKRTKEITCQYHNLYGKITDFSGRPVKAFIGICPDSFLGEKLGKWSDEEGNYEVDLPERTYNALPASTLHYAKSDLEAWAWHIIMDSDQRLDYKIGTGEVYGLNVWANNGGGANYFITFRPMNLFTTINAKKYPLQIDEKEFEIQAYAPDLGAKNIKVKVNGKEAEILSVQKYFETTSATMGIPNTLVQVNRKGLDQLGKMTVLVEYEQEIETDGKKVVATSMGVFQFYPNYSNLSTFF